MGLIDDFLFSRDGVVNEKSNEVIKQLNRLANDRTLAPQARNQLLNAIRHIKELQLKVSKLIRD